MPSPVLGHNAQIDDLVGDLDKVLPVQQITPGLDYAFGGSLLVLIVVLHGFFMRFVQSFVSKGLVPLKRNPSELNADLLLARAIFALMTVQLLEMFIWAATLVYSGLIPHWNDAAYFTANTYTTLGCGASPLGLEWRMIAPIIAIAGLFTFGWTGSVLVNVVGSIARVKEEAWAAKVEAAERAAKNATGSP